MVKNEKIKAYQLTKDFIDVIYPWLAGANPVKHFGVKIKILLLEWAFKKQSVDIFFYKYFLGKLPLKYE